MDITEVNAKTQSLIEAWAKEQNIPSYFFSLDLDSECGWIETKTAFTFDGKVYGYGYRLTIQEFEHRLKIGVNIPLLIFTQIKRNFEPIIAELATTHNPQLS